MTDHVLKPAIQWFECASFLAICVMRQAQDGMLALASVASANSAPVAASPGCFLRGDGLKVITNQSD